MRGGCRLSFNIYTGRNSMKDREGQCVSKEGDSSRSFVE